MPIWRLRLDKSGLLDAAWHALQMVWRKDQACRLRLPRRLVLQRRCFVQPPSPAATARSFHRPLAVFDTARVHAAGATAPALFADRYRILQPTGSKSNQRGPKLEIYRGRGRDKSPDITAAAWPPVWPEYQFDRSTHRCT